jgi:hypothetical protein
MANPDEIHIDLQSLVLPSVGGPASQRSTFFTDLQRKDAPVFHHILGFLDAKSLSELAPTNKAFEKAISQNSIWQVS